MIAGLLALVVGFLLLHTQPRYELLPSPFVQTTWQNALQKADDPLLDMSKRFAAGSHESKLTFRLTVPVIARALGIRQRGIMAWSALTGLVLLAVVLRVARRIGLDPVSAWGVTVAVAGSWAGASGFVELRGGFYDSVALGLAMLALVSPRPALTAILIFLALWTDERALLAAYFVGIYFGDRRVRALLAGVGAYAASRLALALILGLTTSTENVGLAVLGGQVALIPAGLWTGLNCAWLVPLCAVCVAAIRREWRFAAIFGAGLAATALVAGSVYDVTRSAAYALPAVPCALQYLAPRMKVERLCWLAGALAVVVPLYYVQGPGNIWPVLPVGFPGH